MELRHLRYFVAVAEEGSFTHAAEKRLHTAQPSLSRQIRDLETELGAPLMTRGPRGLELTAAGRVFLDHARSILWQVEAAAEAARRAAQPAKASFVVGFLTGYEIEWLPAVMDILRNELPRTEIVIHSASSPELIQSLQRGKVDAAFLRPDKTVRGLAFRHITTEPLFALLPRGHALADERSIDPADLARDTFISFSKAFAPALRRVIDNFARRSEVTLRHGPEAETLPSVISLVLSTPGVSLLPDYARRLLPPLVTAVPLSGDPPTIDLAIGYNSVDDSPLVRLLLEGAGRLIGQSLASPPPQQALPQPND